MTHKELVKFASECLERKRCFPVATEISTCNTSGEIPDAIGWMARASILIECKATRSDFLKDHNKIFRYDLPEAGMGDFRFYFTNPGVVKSEAELPAGWGVYECVPGKKPVHRFGVRFTNAGPLPLKGNKDNEITVMRSIIRRMKKETK